MQSTSCCYLRLLCSEVADTTTKLTETTTAKKAEDGLDQYLQRYR